MRPLLTETHVAQKKSDSPEVFAHALRIGSAALHDSTFAAWPWFSEPGGQSCSSGRGGSMSSFVNRRPGKARRRVNRSLPGLEALERRETPSTFHVNSLLDTVAVNLKTGKDASGHISLRSAIQAADAKPNADTIILPAGTITLTIAGAGENNAATGDLDIHGSVTIKGKGAGEMIVDGNNLDRVFDIFSGNVRSAA